MSNIAIFSANFLPNTGGVERYTYNLAKELSSRGHKVSIITSNVFNLSIYEKISGSIEIFRMPCINLLKGRYPILNKFTVTFFKLDKKIKKKTYDLVIVNTRFYFHSLYGAVFGSKYAKKVICIEHGSSHLSINLPFFDFLGRGFEHFITSLIKKKISDFYGVSSKCNEWLKHFHIDAKGVLYNAVDIDSINEVKKEKLFVLKDYDIPKSAKIVTFAGRLVYEKGILKLIEAVKLLNTKYNRKDIYLLAAGDGPLEDKCRELATQNIYILGRLDSKYVLSMMSVSNIFCLPTIYPEGFPTSILEAIATDNYIIVTPTSGVNEILLDNSYGTVLTENPDSEEIASAILSVIDDDKKQKSSKRKCLELLKNNFIWVKTASEIEKLI